MATFLFVHGAWHGGWCFDDVRARLEADGHRTLAPDLPGMGGTDAELAAVTLDGWADFIADLVRAEAEPVWLVAHSRGGIVISETAQRVPERLAGLIYVCAMMLPDGMSRADWRDHAAPNPDFLAIQMPHSSGHARIIDTARAAPVFAQLSPPDKVAAALTRLVAEPEGPRTARLHLTPDRYGRVPRHYVECLQDRTILLADQRTMQAFQPCDTVRALDADHSPYLSTPAAMVQALEDIAAGR